jgi:hypothetical protein
VILIAGLVTAMLATAAVALVDVAPAAAAGAFAATPTTIAFGSVPMNTLSPQPVTVTLDAGNFV